MTIDINELRRKVNSADVVDHIGLHANIKPFLSEMLDRLEAAESARRDDYQNWMTALDRNAELLAKLEAAERERDELRSLVVMRFDHDHPPQFTQGYDTHELTEPVTAEHCRWFVAEIERLSAEVAHIKEVEFPRKAQAVADGWRGKCERLEAKITEMERQEPVMWANSSNINSSRINRERGGCGDQHTCSETQTAYHDTRLYALPGAKGEEK